MTQEEADKMPFWLRPSWQVQMAALFRAAYGEEWEPVQS